VSGDSWSKRTPAEPGPPPSPIPSDYAVIPWPIDIDPYHTGRLEGRVPSGWSRDGWIMVTRDRMKRTNDEVVLGMLRAELDAVEGVADLDSSPSEAVAKRQYRKGCGAKGINGVGCGPELKRKPNTCQHGDDAGPSVEGRANHVTSLDSLSAIVTQRNWTP